MKDEALIEFKKKLVDGLALSFLRLKEKTIREGGELVVSRDGKIIRLQAKDLK